VVRQAEIGLEKRVVKSPLAGRIEELNFRAGEVVTTGQPVMALLPPGNVKVRFFVPEPKVSQLGVGTVVGITCVGCPPV
jgi:HlyD family secretion protein